MKRGLLIACVGMLAAGAARAEIKGDAIKIGVLNDMTGVYADNGGPGSVVAAQLAAEDFGNVVNGKPIVILQADDQNKADVGAALARQWFDRDGVLAVADMVPSPVALAVQDLVRQNHKISLNSGSVAESLFQENCAATAFTWTHDSYSIANGTVSGVWQTTRAPWFFISTDLGPAAQLAQQARTRLTALGGSVAGSVKAAVGTSDFSPFLVAAQASGAGVLAVNTLGWTPNTVKQAVEFGLNHAMVLVAPILKSRDILAIGLPIAAGQLQVTAFYEDVSPEARTWTNRFMARRHVIPTDIQAGVYSSVRHLLQAVKDTNSDDGEVVAAKMHATPVSDAFTRDGVIRPDGRLSHDVYLMKVKSPAESADPQTDIWQRVATIPADQALPPLSASRCPLVKAAQ
jgi:ABC-type branched-subunit amino acid transport system substrate-binding protein